jgi:cbb3-type cytochrome oxidase maturation protein
MSIIFVLLPISVFFGLCGLIAYLWSLRSGQLDDLETPALRMLFDDEQETAQSPEESEDASSDQECSK